MVRFQLMFWKIFSLNSNFQDLFIVILYFSVAQILVDFLICIYRGKLKKVYASVVFNWFQPFDLFQNCFSRKL